MLGLLRDPKVAPETRWRIGAWLVERTLGKPPLVAHSNSIEPPPFFELEVEPPGMRAARGTDSRLRSRPSAAACP